MSHVLGRGLQEKGPYVKSNIQGRLRKRGMKIYMDLYARLHTILDLKELENLQLLSS